MLFIFLYSYDMWLGSRTGNSIGGVVEVVARNVPSGLGSPVFDKLEAELAKACMSLPASKGFEVSKLYLIIPIEN
jgi:chorismate synthase